MASTPARQLKNGPRLVDAPPVRAEKPARNPEEKVQKTGTMDRPLLLLIFLLVGLGLLCLFSASYATAYDSKDGHSTFYIFRQAIFAVGGSAAMLVLSRRNYHKLHYLAIPSLILAVAVMATIKVPGLKNMWVTINQATPENGAAQVAVSVRTGTMQMSVEEMMRRLVRQRTVVEVHRGL